MSCLLKFAILPILYEQTDQIGCSNNFIGTLRRFARTML